VTGLKHVAQDDPESVSGITRAVGGLALAMVALVAAFWAYQWWWAP
jgi:hypothetical protein